MSIIIIIIKCSLGKLVTHTKSLFVLSPLDPWAAKKDLATTTSSPPLCIHPGDSLLFPPIWLCGLVWIWCELKWSFVCLTGWQISFKEAFQGGLSAKHEVIAAMARCEQVDVKMVADFSTWVFLGGVAGKYYFLQFSSFASCTYFPLC